MQSEGESLVTYVRSIRDAALALVIRKVEGQFVGRIVKGLNPTQRARFVFQSPTFHFFALGTSDGSGSQHRVR